MANKYAYIVHVFMQYHYVHIYVHTCIWSLCYICSYIYLQDVGPMGGSWAPHIWYKMVCYICSYLADLLYTSRLSLFICMYDYQCKSLTAAFISEFETMMTLGGSPTAVAVPPMLEKTTSAINTGRGSRFNTWQSLRIWIMKYDAIFSSLAIN